ncbi:MAG: hypothetical protein IJP64_03385 [Oscillospiraceae bacterium]|nr:hypothetical protein [Oscillospiraceae bacterium]
MRHPALTRFFAAFLAVMSAITLVSGALCIKKAADDREKQNTAADRLAEKTAEAKELRTELDAMPVEFGTRSEAYDEAKESYDREKNSYRKDLSIYTATEAGLKQGSEQIEEGYAALRMGWIAHDNGEKQLDEAEAQFLPGYEQYLAGKEQLEEGRRQLAQTEALRDSLPDLAILRTALDALKSSRAEISASLDTIQNTLDHPPVDPESGETDRAAQSMLLRKELLVLSRQLQAVQTVLVEQYGAETLSKELSSSAAALGRQAETLAGGELNEEELIASAQQILNSGQSLSGAFDSAISGAEQTLTTLESLPALKEQLDEAEAALKEGEPMLLEAKKGFEEGRAQLEQAKNQLIWAEAELIKGKKALEEKQAEQEELKEDLDRRKLELEEEAERLETELREIENYREKQERMSNLRYALKADGGIAERMREGEGLIESAETELAERRVSIQNEYVQRMAAALLMLAAALCGLLTLIPAFREKGRAVLLLGAALAFVLAAAAEGISFWAGRGMIYTVLFVGVFGAAVLALNVRKA